MRSRFSLRTCPRLLVLIIVAGAGLGASTATVRADDPPKGESGSRKVQKKAKSEKDAKKGSESEKKTKMPALKFKMKDIDGKKQDLRQYEGNVVVMVNVASKCGLTPHYEGIEKLYEKYKDRGLIVLGFPANNFGGQEPGTDEEIKEFCTTKFDVTFPMFSKVSVKGDDICPLYKYLTDAKSDHKFTGDIEWNFAKILVNRRGEVVGRFNPRTSPDDEKFIEAIESQLEEPIPEDSALAKKLKKEEKADGKNGDDESKSARRKKPAASR